MFIKIVSNIKNAIYSKLCLNFRENCNKQRQDTASLVSRISVVLIVQVILKL